MSYNKMTRDIKYIVVHETDTPNGKYFDVDDVERWHKERGEWGPSKITKKYVGYHWIILIDGTVQSGRHPDEVGVHAKGYNSNSLGICLVGRGKYTQAQWDSLQSLLGALQGQYNSVKIIGHNEVSNKTCPGFNVQKYLSSDMVPDEENVLKV